ncbi:hypothetical protein OSB04_004122 [Centaurea solstitialis]|uniref:EF-hand domain-containing protein n=1 Tax=Centaurea solstitialis TaxID=347529 RepID=A0AA38U8L7_9ASTR|nr:hypothetical protein OSB04_004122 [Centaurea solstitialis]
MYWMWCSDFLIMEPKASVPTSKLEAQILDAIILKFPKIDESLRRCKVIFEQFDEDKSGAIDLKELKNCLDKLKVNFTNEEINEIFKTCDLNDDMGISFNEFIVLLCLVYLLKEDPAADQNVSNIAEVREVQGKSQKNGKLRNIRVAFIWTKSRLGIPDLEATFETLVESFVFLDSNRDGHVSKNEMVRAIEETRSGGHSDSDGQIAMKRFEEMDWDKNGMVNFKEFLFAFTRWVGLEDDEED